MKKTNFVWQWHVGSIALILDEVNITNLFYNYLRNLAQHWSKFSSTECARDFLYQLLHSSSTVLLNQNYNLLILRKKDQNQSCLVDDFSINIIYQLCIKNHI